MISKKITFGLLLTFLISTFSFSQTSNYNTLLEKYVNSNGLVNYQGLKSESTQLQKYLDYLSKTSPQSSWSNNQQKAFWINAYNAYTLKLVLDNYPLTSINEIKKDGKKAWDIPFVKVGGKTYTLNYVEHTILRKKYNDPRIHVGVNCASYSCPKLYNKAFTEKNIDSSLTFLMKSFINDANRNIISANKVQLSQIFNWFKSDFTKKDSLISYLNKFSKTKINTNTPIEYLKYNWTLNKK